MVVAGGHDGSERPGRTVLRQDAEAVQVSAPARHVQRRVAAVVHQRRVAAGQQEALTHLGLLRDHRQVQRSLGREGRGGELTHFDLDSGTLAIEKYQIYKLISRHRVARYELVGLIFFVDFL